MMLKSSPLQVLGIVLAGRWDLNRAQPSSKSRGKMLLPLSFVGRPGCSKQVAAIVPGSCHSGIAGQGR